MTTDAFRILAAGTDTTSPLYAAFIAIISGTLIGGLVTLYKARPDRDLTVASTAEKQVVLSMSMLESERARADRAENQRDAAEAERDGLEAELVALRAQVEDLTRQLDHALTRIRESRDHRPHPQPRREPS